MSDRILTASFAASLSIHFVVLISQWGSLPWAGKVRNRAPIEVIYSAQPAEKQQLQLETQVMRARRDTTMAPLTASLGERTQIRIPDRPLLGSDATALTQSGAGGGSVGGGASTGLPDIERSPVVDLANLLETAGSNPVMLSYFSVIRDQIQHTANTRDWAAGTPAEGIIYVRFVLVSNGAVRAAGVVGDKSAASGALRTVAMQIVQTAAPFPPFPPSLQDSSKDVVVPLEFMLGP